MVETLFVYYASACRNYPNQNIGGLIVSSNISGWSWRFYHAKGQDFSLYQDKCILSLTSASLKWPGVKTKTSSSSKKINFGPVRDEGHREHKYICVSYIKCIHTQSQQTENDRHQIWYFYSTKCKAWTVQRLEWRRWSEGIRLSFTGNYRHLK